MNCSKLRVVISRSLLSPLERLREFTTHVVTQVSWFTRGRNPRLAHSGAIANCKSSCLAAGEANVEVEGEVPRQVGEGPQIKPGRSPLHKPLGPPLLSRLKI